MSGSVTNNLTGILQGLQPNLSVLKKEAGLGAISLVASRSIARFVGVALLPETLGTVCVLVISIALYQGYKALVSEIAALYRRTVGVTTAVIGGAVNTVANGSNAIGKAVHGAGQVAAGAVVETTVATATIVVNTTEQVVDAATHSSGDARADRVKQEAVRAVVHAVPHGQAIAATLLVSKQVIGGARQLADMCAQVQKFKVRKQRQQVFTYLIKNPVVIAHMARSQDPQKQKMAAVAMRMVIQEKLHKKGA